MRRTQAEPKGWLVLMPSAISEELVLVGTNLRMYNRKQEFSFLKICLFSLLVGSSLLHGRFLGLLSGCSVRASHYRAGALGTWTQ